jgi:hypothetical protein
VVGRWILLAFIPSSWLLGVTTYLTTDLAAIPLLWTVPLAVYLFTYIVAFARGSDLWTHLASSLLPLIVVPLVLVLSAGLVQLFWMPVHLLAFLIGALVCHGQLAASRPAPNHLTGFYLAVAAGGALGGAFNALLAPLIFDRLAEYPAAAVLACLVAPGAGTSGNARRLSQILTDLCLPSCVFAVSTILAVAGRDAVDTVAGITAVLIASGLGIYACVTGLRRPLRFALTAAAVLLAGALAERPGGRVVYRNRDFFGILTVMHDPRTNVNRLSHGNTLHGQQNLDASGRQEPSTYYARSGPIGQVFAMMEPELKAQPYLRVAVIGLGVGTLACYAQGGQNWTFYEIDPAVVRIAEEPRFFTYVSDARSRGVNLRIITGDARVRLEEAPEHVQQIIVLDAFSSDAIPVHLLTREAVRLYMSKLARPGVLALHLTNRYVDLEPVVAGLAAAAGLVCRIRRDVNLESAERDAGKQASIWAVMARTETDLGEVATDSRWLPLRVCPGARVWSDDYSDLASYLVLGATPVPGQKAPETPAEPTHPHEP